MKNITRRQILIILVLFEIAIFICDFAGILLISANITWLMEFALFALISLLAIHSLNKESKIGRSYIKLRSKNNELEKQLKSCQTELQSIKTAANETRTSTKIIKQMRRNEE